MTMSLLQNYHHFDGLPWATGYLLNTLAYKGVVAPHTNKPYTEAMLMGINGGLCAGYFAFEYEGYDPHLHFLTRYLFDENPGAVFERLNIPIETRQTSDPQKAVANVINALAQGQPAIVWADVTSLGYSTDLMAGDYWLVMPLLVYGYDMQSGEVNIADRARVPLTASHASVAAARARLTKTRHRMMTIGAPDPNRLPSAIRAGIHDCIAIFTGKPPVGAASSFGFEAYRKWADLLTNPRNKRGWATMFAPGQRMVSGLTSAYKFIELWYTGGRGARHIYGDFLDEAASVLDKATLRDAAGQFRLCAERWDALARALLPDTVALFRDLCDLMRQDYELFVSQGNASLDKRRDINTRLDALKADAGANFPLTDAEAAAMRAELRERVLAICAAEEAAIQMLIEANV